jgi:hypothetical protein
MSLHSPAHCCSMQVSAASTAGQVPRSVHDRQQVSAHDCSSPSSVHIEPMQVNDGMQKAFIAHVS